MHSPFVKQMLNLWSNCNRIIPKDWTDMVIAVAEADPTYNGGLGVRVKLRPLNNEVKLEVLKFLKTNSLRREILI